MQRTQITIAHFAITLACLCGVIWLAMKKAEPLPLLTKGVIEDHRQHDEVDNSLRNHLRVWTIGRDCRVPADINHCTVTLLKFVNGKMIGRGNSTTWSREFNSEGLIRHEVLGTRGSDTISVIGYGVWSDDRHEFYRSLGGYRGTLHGSMSFGFCCGYRVMGFCASNEKRDGIPENHRADNQQAAKIIQIYRHVLLLGIKPFPTAEEASSWLASGQDIEMKMNPEINE